MNASEQSSLMEELRQARRELLRHQPFIASIVLQQEVCEDDKPEHTIATSGKRLLVNPEFFSSLSPEEQVYALAHCAWHCALLHQWRRGDRDKELWDMACDIEVYNRLSDDSGMTCPSRLAGGISKLADDYWSESAERIYDALASRSRLKKRKSPIDQHLEECPRPSCRDDQEDASSDRRRESEQEASAESTERLAGDQDSPDSRTQDCGGSSDEEKAATFDGMYEIRPEDNSDGLEDSQKGEEESDDSETSSDFASDNAPSAPDGLDAACEVIAMVRNAVEESKQIKAVGIGTGIGNVPGCVVELLDSLKPPSQDWREILADYVTKCHEDQRRWYPSSRRHIWRGVYLPSIRGERLRPVVAIDTSGSTCDYASRFFSEMLGIVRSTCSQYEMTMIECDCNIQNVQKLTEFSQSEIGRKWAVHGLGGTDFRPVFEYVKDNDLAPDVLIYFTDGWGAAPDDAPDYPVIWCLPDADGMRAPCAWGKEIRIPVECLTP